MRLIDADALKETFEIAYKEARHDIEYANAFFSDAGEVSTEWWCVEDMVDNAPTIEPQQWIPVSERLPDIKEHHVSEPCIVYFENGAYGFTELEENIFGQVGWYCEREDEFHESLGKVLAWMPIPKPYKE